MDINLLDCCWWHAQCCWVLPSPGWALRWLGAAAGVGAVPTHGRSAPRVVAEADAATAHRIKRLLRSTSQPEANRCKLQLLSAGPKVRSLHAPSGALSSLQLYDKHATAPRRRRSLGYSAVWPAAVRRPPPTARCVSAVPLLPPSCHPPRHFSPILVPQKGSGTRLLTGQHQGMAGRPATAAGGKQGPDDDPALRLLLAAGDGEAEIVRSLCELGLDPNASHPNIEPAGATPLHFAAQHASGGATIRALAAAGAALNCRNCQGETPLMYAACRGHAANVRALLQLGANAEAADAAGRTALMMAAHAGHGELLRSRVDRCWPPAWPRSAPCRQRQPGPDLGPASWACPNLLLHDRHLLAPANCSLVVELQRALHVTCKQTHTPLCPNPASADNCVEQLLAGGASPRARCTAGLNALALAAGCSRVRCVELLAPVTPAKARMAAVEFAARAQSAPCLRALAAGGMTAAEAGRAVFICMGDQRLVSLGLSADNPSQLAGEEAEALPGSRAACIAALAEAGANLNAAFPGRKVGPAHGIPLQVARGRIAVAALQL